MHIALDAQTFEHIETGISKATRRLYDACHIAAPDVIVSGLHHRPLPVPLSEWIQPMTAGRAVPTAVWRNSILPLMVLMLHPDVVHFPWNGRVPIWMPGVKIATTIFDVLPLSIPGFLKTEAERARYCGALQRDILRSDVIITCSEYSKAEIMRHFRVRSEPEVIHIGVTLDNVASSVALSRADGYFLYVGGYGKRKGVEGLVRVFLGLHRERLIRSRLVLTGDRSYYSEEFRALVQSGVDLGLVEELGYVSESALPDLYRNATALVYPSKYEGFGLPPLEAMSVGCPVITTRCTAIPEVCGDAAYYINPDDERDFGAALIALETNGQLRSELAGRGLERVKRFSWSSAAQRFLDLLSRPVSK